MNQITHWLDASNVYGSQDDMSDRLRSFSNGLMRVTEENGRERLPIDNNLPCEDSQGRYNYTWYGSDLSRLVQTCPDLSRIVQTCPDLSSFVRLVQTCPDMFR